MGRIVRRFARFHQVEVTDNLFQDRAIAAALVENVHGMRLRQTIRNIVLTGHMYGIHLEQELLGAAGQIGPNMYGLLIEQYIDNAASVVTGMLAGIHITNYILSTTLGTYTAFRFHEGGGMGGTNMHSIFNIHLGGVTDTNVLFYLSPAACTAWATTGTPGGAAGWLRHNVGGAIRYVQLYQTPP